jgi:mannitol-specific phosphotransferase system IIBC component
VVAVLVAIGIAAFFHSLFSVILASVVTLLLVISLLLSRKSSEKEMMRKQDRLLGKPPDNSGNMGNFVP